MRFMQHLIETLRDKEEKLLEVNSQKFLNVLLEAAGEELLSEAEAFDIPTKMTVGDLITMYEARGLPPKMNYQFDEVEPDLDKNSFRNARTDRLRAEREREEWDEREHAAERAHEYHAETGGREFYEPGGQPWDGRYTDRNQSAPRDKFKDRLRASREAGNDRANPGRMYKPFKSKFGGEEEMEQKMPAYNDIKSSTSRQRKEEDGVITSKKRIGQQAGRRLRSNYGRGNPSKNAKGYMEFKD